MTKLTEAEINTLLENLLNAPAVPLGSRWGKAVSAQQVVELAMALCELKILRAAQKETNP